ncbi:MAG: hypothetical protein ABIZ91_12745 [Gemmatimonadaceae bacterium]
MRKQEQGTKHTPAPAVKATDGKKVSRRPPIRADDSDPIMRAIEGGPPLPEELTGRASNTGESLTELFMNGSAEHLADGFRGGSGDDPGTRIAPDDEGELLRTAGDAAEDEDSLDDGAAEADAPPAESTAESPAPGAGGKRPEKEKGS